MPVHARPLLGVVHLAAVLGLGASLQEDLEETDPEEDEGEEPDADGQADEETGALG